ncbi:Coiled-coil domain-containing protein 47 [Papilio machaon]|uniref:PAT complex subunit CCDC47 n=1 Tax=Papilio machaon TaxID=76193 RepID=A0A0N1IGW9_PAPMA|nr:Coiled-coil domain-containing protein 47 [Papilio machaon]
MRLVLLSIALLLCSVYVKAFEDPTLEDDDFAEFEQFDADDDATVADFSEDEKEVPVEKKAPTKDKFSQQRDVEDDMLVEDEDNEFEHFQDPEEFEGFQDSVPRSSEQPKITISKVPISVRRRWDAYWLEGILCCALAAYAMAYVIGRAKNTSIALNFLKLHKPLLEDNFTLVGETGADVACAEGERGWRREAEHCFTMWCSGRVCCEGMLLTLKLIKVTIVFLRETGADVACAEGERGWRREAEHCFTMWCSGRVCCEGMLLTLKLIKATAGVLDSRLCGAITQYQKHVQYIHISDRYCGPKLMEDTAMTKPPETERVLLASFALSPGGGGDEVRPLLQLVFYLLEKLKRLRLSKEALAKCEKRRQKVAEAWLRGAHAARQEQAAQRREEKRKQEKERILAEDDPEKQRRWELKEQKRQQKRKAPKLKQLKVKAL